MALVPSLSDCTLFTMRPPSHSVCYHLCFYIWIILSVHARSYRRVAYLP
jgi:hypothetical protein